LDQTNPASIIVAIAGMAFVVLGLMQYMASIMKNADKRRQEIFAELEVVKLKNLELTADRDKYKRMYFEARSEGEAMLKYIKRIRKERNNLKGQLIDCLGIEPEIPLSGSDVDDPEIGQSVLNRDDDPLQ
jgi:F0F1-type ATP synthase membrane subunit b/b'